MKIKNDAVGRTFRERDKDNNFVGAPREYYIGGPPLSESDLVQLQVYLATRK
jgi:hypothetical protein